MGKGGQQDKGRQQGKGGQPDLTDLAEAAQVRINSLCLSAASISATRASSPSRPAVGPHHRSLSSPSAPTPCAAQTQFDFFAQAVPFLQAATSDELLRTVAEYTRFLAAGARSCPSFAVELVWRTHLLMPAAYAKDCEALAGRVLDHDILPVGVYSLAAPVESESELPCDGLRVAQLVGAMRRQQSFMEKMLARRSAMDAPDYLALSVRQYGQFLALMKRHCGVMLVPTLAIDLVCVLRNLHLSDLSDQQTIRVEIVEPATNPLSLVGA